MKQGDVVRPRELPREAHGTGGVEVLKEGRGHRSLVPPRHVGTSRKQPGETPRALQKFQAHVASKATREAARELFEALFRFGCA